MALHFNMIRNITVSLPYPKDAKMSQDGSFWVLNRSAGYHIPPRDWHKFFEEDKAGTLQEELASKSFAVHYWNHMRGEEEISISPHHLLYKLFKANCPSTERNILQNLIGLNY